MEFEGKYRVKAVRVFSEGGSEYLSAAEIAALEDSEENEDVKAMVKMSVDISEKELAVKISVTPEEAEQARQEDEDAVFDEDGLLVLERHEIICDGGVFKYECGESDGEPFFAPFARTEDGDLLYGETIVLERV